MYWIPLLFDTSDAVTPLAPFVAQTTIDLRY